jgi:hypothetical protein
LLPTQQGGENKRDILFNLEEESVPPGLHLRLDEPPKGHYVLEPERMMPIQDYEALLERTQGLWKQVTP